MAFLETIFSLLKVFECLLFFDYCIKSLLRVVVRDVAPEPFEKIN